MKFYNIHVSSMLKREGGLVIGFTGGRAPCHPEAEWIYSLRIFLLIFRVEILWFTGENHDHSQTELF